MDGDRGGFNESGVSPPAIDLPAVLAGLDGTEAERREAIGTIREAVAEEPAACAPTIPKLRDLLSEDEREEATVAHCLAEIAEASPTDVAPSADHIAEFVVETHPSPAATEGLRALAAIAEAKPAAVDDHADRLAGAIESGPDLGRDSPRLWNAVARLGRAVPSVATPATREERSGGPDDRSPDRVDHGAVAVVPERDLPDT